MFRIGDKFKELTRDSVDWKESLLILLLKILSGLEESAAFNTLTANDLEHPMSPMKKEMKTSMLGNLQAFHVYGYLLFVVRLVVIFWLIF